MNPKITVVDSIMGSGKSSAIFNLFNQNPDKNYIYVTPYLTEINRIKEDCSHIFREPVQFGEGKLSSLHYLLSAGYSIATTHALFLRANDETIQLIREGDYTLVLDEELNVFQEFNAIQQEQHDKCVNRDDVDLLLRENLISVDEKHHVSWIGASCADSHYSEVERLAKNGTLRCVDHALHWEYPINVFKAFTEVFILTYLFEGSILAAYLRLNNLPYENLAATKNEHGQFVLTEHTDDTELRRSYEHLISIYDGELNHIGARHNAFSFNWLLHLEGKRLQNLKTAMRRYRDLTKAHSHQIMWTTAKKDDFHLKLEQVYGFKYIRKLSKDDLLRPEEDLRLLRCFVPCNARATNSYADRTVLLYLLNRYLPPEVEKYFASQGCPIDESLFATSELLQWIWRSAIRKDQPIKLYIPSYRMRRLLYAWLGVPYEPHTKTLEYTA